MHVLPGVQQELGDEEFSRLHSHMLRREDPGMASRGRPLDRRHMRPSSGTVLTERSRRSRDINATQTVEVEDEALDTATDVVNELSNASIQSTPDDTQTEEDAAANLTLLGPAGRPALVFAGMYGDAGAVGPRGVTGPAGVAGPVGPAGASVVGHAGAPGMPGTAGTKGKMGAAGAKGFSGEPGTPGGPPPELEKWTKLLDYYTEIIYRMESAASTHIRGSPPLTSIQLQPFGLVRYVKSQNASSNDNKQQLTHYKDNQAWKREASSQRNPTKQIRVMDMWTGFKREASMLQQHSAIFKARTETLNNRSAQLHSYVMDPWPPNFSLVSARFVPTRRVSRGPL